MVFVQKWPLFQPVFLGNIDKENVFHDILAQRKAFLGYKNKKFKKSKNWHFSRGVNPWFFPKNGNFSNVFFLGNIGQENVFFDILKRKNAFVGFKNKKLKIRKIDTSPKGFTHGLCPKMAIIPTCFFKQYRQGKCLLRYFTTKKVFSRLENVFYHILERKKAFVGYKNKKFKESKNCHFSKGGKPWFWSKNDHFSKLLFSGNIGF